MQPRDLRRAVLAGIALAALTALAGCRGRSGAPAAAPAEPDRFPHRAHGTLACVDCHALPDVLGGRPAIPGAADHQPCDRSGCHREAFLAAPGKLCTICHRDVDPTVPGTGELRYPPAKGRRALAARFSHASHLDYARMEKQVGFHVSCTDCHVAEDGEPKLPDHAVCGRCHAPEAAPPGAPAMGQCGACHKADATEPPRRRRLIVGDLRFHHENHRADRAGVGILCTTCHTDSAQVAATGAHKPPPVATCVDCHDDDKRTPSSLRMRACSTCHGSEELGLTQIPPRSHLPAPDRPADHTLAFRSDHGADARRDARRCAKCHTQMSGAARDTCDECHQLTPPRDHNTLWREYDHGSGARERSERCAVCHQADFCVACHSRPPRSHFPISTFRTREHASIARFDVRACITCHEPTRDCTSGGCHTVAPE
jgi:hypothetical protein